jgi:hypothetical protein
MTTIAKRCRSAVVPDCRRPSKFFEDGLMCFGCTIAAENTGTGPAAHGINVSADEGPECGSLSQAQLDLRRPPSCRFQATRDSDMGQASGLPVCC